MEQEKNNKSTEENQVFEEQKKRIENYLNDHSRQIFILMLIAIAISIIFSVYTALSKKSQDLPPVNLKIEQSTKDGCQEFDDLMNSYRELKEKNKKADALIEEIETFEKTQKPKKNKYDED